MSKVFKKIGKKIKKGIKHLNPIKAIKSAWKKIKKVWKSTVGKIVIAVVAIALLWWAAGAFMAAGAGAGTAGGGAASSGALLAGQTSVVGAGAAGTGAAVGAGAAGAQAAAAQLIPLGVSGAGTAGAGIAAGAGAVGASAGGSLLAGQTSVLAAPAVAPAGVATGTGAAVGQGAVTGVASAAPASGTANSIFNTVKGLGTKALNFAKNNELVTAGLINGAASALSKPQYEQEREWSEKDRKRQEANLNVGDVDLGIEPGDGQLRRPDGTQVFNTDGTLRRNVDWQGATAPGSGGIMGSARNRSAANV